MVMSRCSATRLLLDWVRALTNNCHGSRAARTNRAYGLPSDGSFPSLPKKTVNTPMVNSGWMTAQATPRAVCLYRSLTSRRVRNQSSSRYCQTSRRSIARHPRLGRMRVTSGRASVCGAGRVSIVAIRSRSSGLAGSPEARPRASPGRCRPPCPTTCGGATALRRGPSDAGSHQYLCATPGAAHRVSKHREGHRGADHADRRGIAPRCRRSGSRKRAGHSRSPHARPAHRVHSESG